MEAPPHRCDEQTSKRVYNAVHTQAYLAQRNGCESCICGGVVFVTLLIYIMVTAGDNSAEKTLTVFRPNDTWLEVEREALIDQVDLTLFYASSACIASLQTSHSNGTLEPCICDRRSVSEHVKVRWQRSAEGWPIIRLRYPTNCESYQVYVIQSVRLWITALTIVMLFVLPILCGICWCYTRYYVCHRHIIRPHDIPLRTVELHRNVIIRRLIDIPVSSAYRMS